MAYQPTIQERRAAMAVVYLTDALKSGKEALTFVREYAASSGVDLSVLSDEQIGWAYAAAIRGCSLEDKLDQLGRRIGRLERSAEETR